MRIGIARPLQQACEGALRPAKKESAHRELGAETAGEFVLSAHRGLEGIAAGIAGGIGAVGGDVVDVWEVEEDSQTERVGAGERRRERAEEDRDGFVVARREMRAEGVGEAAGQDARCQAAWARARARFFGEAGA